MWRSFLGPPRRGPGEAKSCRATTEFEKLQKHVCKKKTSFFEIYNSTADPRCQTETVPEGGKSCRATTEFENFIHVLAAHLPTPVPTRPSLPNPTPPHVKDYPGLGDPNTLKLLWKSVLNPRKKSAYETPSHKNHQKPDSRGWGAPCSI